MLDCRPLSLKEGEIHVWALNDEEIQDGMLLDSYRELLSAEESAKQVRFHFDKHRHQYLLARALVRTTLSRYCPEVLPDKWVFDKNDFGKPHIANPAIEPALKFNLSHTEKCVLLAVTLEKDLGIDVEYLNRRGETLKIAKHYFSSTEINYLFALPEGKRQSHFFDLWTLKEAYIKACGKGLAIPLDQFSFLFDDNKHVTIRFDSKDKDEHAQWHFWGFRPSPLHRAALAIKDKNDAKPYRVTIYRCVPLSSHYNEADMAFTITNP